VAFTKRHQDTINEMQDTIDELTLELTAAKMENERLAAECKAWDEGRDELVESHQAELADCLEFLQNHIVRIREMERKVEEMQAIVDHHKENCLQEFKNYISPNGDVTTTER
jgi:chromosome segregation ATPase